MPSARSTMGSGRWASSDSSRRLLRERSRLRATRPTAATSQASRLSISPAFERLSRIHASWTASSASLVELSIR